MAKVQVGTSLQTQELREFEKLDTLLSQIPKKAQHGLLKSCDLVLTCIDANKTHIALGSNVGVVFLYNRRNQLLQRLRTTGNNDVITCVTIHEGIDFQLAVGTESGEVAAFCIPNVGPNEKKQTQKFDVKGYHKNFVSSVEWSTNGMKLYSGDKKGLIVATEVDFHERLCKSSVFIEEPNTEIVQLDYLHKALLVSTRHRSFVVRLDKQAQIVNVGTQDRKVVGSFGACFIPDMCKTDDAKLYAARPGCRVWMADIHGAVGTTHVFQDPLSPAGREIPILSMGKPQTNPSSFQFGPLYNLSERELVTWSGSSLVVLDPDQNHVVARQSCLSGIEGIAVVDREIFVLRRDVEARVIRISSKPDPSFVKVEPKTSLIDSSTVENLKQKEKAAKSFFMKTFANPIKKFDMMLLNNKEKDSDGSLEMSPTPHLEEEESPELPPVVRLPSPELSILRVYTVADIDSPTVDGQADIDKGESRPDFPKSLNLVEEEPIQEVDKKIKQYITDEDGLVFSHRMKNPKKKKNKKGKLSGKEEDTMSLASISSVNSQRSDDAEVTQNPTQVNDSLPVTDESARTDISRKPRSDSSLETLQRADDMLQHINDILRGESEGKGQPVTKRQIEQNVVDSDQENVNKDNITQIDATHETIPDSSVDTQLGSELNTDTVLSEKLKHSDKNKSVIGNVKSDELKIEGNQYLENDQSADKPTDNGHPSGSHSGETMTVIQSQEIKLLEDTEINKAQYVSLGLNGGVLGSEDICSVSSLLEKDGDIDSSNLIKEDISLNESLAESDRNIKFNLASTPVEIELEKDEVDIYSTKASTSELRQTPKRQISHNTSSDIINSAFSKLEDTTDITKIDADDKRLQYAMGAQSGSKKSFEESDSFQDIYGNKKGQRSFDESISSPYSSSNESDQRKLNLVRDKSCDDFYSRYLHTSLDSPGLENPLERRQKMTAAIDAERSTHMLDVSHKRVANSWSEFSTPTNMYSLVLSQAHIWYTDKSENIYYSSVVSPKGVLWRKASGSANQISVSPSGQIVWRLHRGVVFAGTKISSRHPEGLKWVEVVRDVEYISVGDDCAWYLKLNGDLMMQKNLSLERPCSKSGLIQCGPHKLRTISAAHGVVWGLTEGLRLLVRYGVSNYQPEGDTWELDQRETAPYLFSSVAVDNQNIGWGIDVLGQIWFCTGVSRSRPAGDGHWWQVAMSEYILQDASTLDVIRSVARRFDPKQLAHILSTSRGGLITAGSQGVWMAMDSRNVLQVCRGHMQGYYWSEAPPANMSPSSTWRLINASAGDDDLGLIWAQQVNGDIFVFRRPGGEATMIPDCFNFCCISASSVAVWALMPSGDIKVRANMTPYCPQGNQWVDLDISQLGSAHMVHLSCNSLYVWAVEAEGVVYQRIGARPPSDTAMSPVWLPIDAFADIVFTRVHSGPLHWMVWAVDNRRLTYVRTGITEDLPIGEEWVHVPGLQAVDLALTQSGVWALTPSGEVYFRYGVSRTDPAGDYWKKIPGDFMKISASCSDDLWGISTEGHLMHCDTRYLQRCNDDGPMTPDTQRSLRAQGSVSEDVDWEIV